MWIRVTRPLGVNSSQSLGRKGNQKQLQTKEELKCNTCNCKSMFWRTTSELRLRTVSIGDNESRHTRAGLDVNQKLTRSIRSAAHLALKDTPSTSKGIPKHQRVYTILLDPGHQGGACLILITLSLGHLEWSCGLAQGDNPQALTKVWSFSNPAVFAFRSWRRVLQQSGWEC